MAEEKRQPKVSFVVPVYNLAPWLDETLDSLCNQTLRDIEVVCVDDGSTDGSAAVLARRAQLDSRVRVITQANGGVGRARNAGLAAARGFYVGFIDGDDLLDAEAAEVLYGEAHAVGADIVVFGAYSFPPKEQWVFEMFGPEDAVVEGDGCDMVLDRRGCIPSAANKLYRRRLLQDHGLLFDERFVLGEDTFFQFCVFPLARCVVFDSRRFYGYRFERPGSAVTEGFKKRRDQQQKHVEVFDAIADAWQADGYLQGRESRFLEAIAFIFYDFELLGEDDRIVVAGRFCEVFPRFFTEGDLEGIYPVERWLYSLMLALGDPAATERQRRDAQRAFSCRMGAYRAARVVKHGARRLLKGKREWE